MSDASDATNVRLIPLTADQCVRGGYWVGRLLSSSDSAQDRLEGGVFYNCLPVLDVARATWLAAPTIRILEGGLIRGEDMRASAGILKRVAGWEAGGPIVFEACDFRDMDLQSAVFGGLRFVDCDFTGSDLRGADLVGTRFEGRCELRGVDVRGADLRDCQLGYSCDMAGARGEGALVAAGSDVATRLGAEAVVYNNSSEIVVTASQIAVDAMRLRGRQGIEVLFKGVRFEGSDMRGAGMKDVSFVGCELQGVNMDGIAVGVGRDGWGLVMKGSELTNVSMRGAAMLCGWRLSGSTLTDTAATALYGVQLELSDVTIQGMAAEWSLIRESSFMNTNLKNASFAYSYLLGLDFEQCVVENVDLRNVFWSAFRGPVCRVAGTTFTGVDFSRRLKSDARVMRVQFEDVTFIRCKLVGTVFVDCRFTRCTFEGSDTSKAFMYDCRFTDCVGVAQDGSGVVTRRDEWEDRVMGDEYKDLLMFDGLGVQFKLQAWLRSAGRKRVLADLGIEDRAQMT